MRVLIVDDDADIAVMLSRIVEHLGYEATPCSQPGEAVSLHATSAFNVVLCDYNMRPTGLEVLRGFPNSYRVVITAGRINKNIRVGVSTGLVHRVLQKPVTIRELSGVLSLAAGAAGG